MLLAYYLDTFSPFIWEISHGIGPHWYGLAYVLAFLCGYLVYHRLAIRRYSQLPPAQVADFITWAALFGVLLGGRLGSFDRLEKELRGGERWSSFDRALGGGAYFGEHEPLEQAPQRDAA